MTGRTISHYNGSGRIRGIYCQSNAAVKPIFEEWMKQFADLGSAGLRRHDRRKTRNQQEDGEMWTEATPDFLCVNDYGSYSGKAQGAVLFGLLSLCPNCAQKSSGISKRIKKYRTPSKSWSS